MYSPKKEVDERIYDNLMDPVDDAELATAVAAADYVCAAGVDDISAGIWRMLCKSAATREVLCAFVSACIRLRMMPAIGKRSIIIPIPKKTNGGKALDNIRPISLQCALTKLLTKILASRLGAILTEHRVLHTAQEGFLPGGQSQACVDVLLDAMESSAQHNSAIHLLFYDLMQAYDTVRRDDLVASLRRLRIHPDFVTLVQDALRDRVAVVRTAFGDTDDIVVDRSVPQGDPWAPILFVCFLDILHCGLAENPLYHEERDGVRLPGVGVVASKGFADDTVIMSHSYRGLRRMHHWCIEWVRWHCMRFHSGKSVLTGRCSDGSLMVNEHIRIDGQLLVACGFDTAIRYLGATIDLELGATSQVTAITQRIAHFCHALERHELRVDRAVFAVNTFLIPSLAYSIAFAQPSSTQAASWDVLVARSIMRLSGHDTIRGMKPVAVATVTGLILPSHYERAVKISEAYLRLNSTGQSGLSARHRWQERKASTSCSNNRLVRTSRLANEVGLHLERVVKSDRVWRIEEGKPAGVGHILCTVNGCDYQLMRNFYGVWGRGERYPTLTFCTDGSVQGRDQWQVAGWRLLSLMTGLLRTGNRFRRRVTFDPTPSLGQPT